MANTSLQYMPDLSRGPDYSAANSMFQAGQRGISEAGTVIDKQIQYLANQEQRKLENEYKQKYLDLALQRFEKENEKDERDFEYKKENNERDFEYKKERDKKSDERLDKADKISANKRAFLQQAMFTKNEKGEIVPDTNPESIGVRALALALQHPEIDTGTFAEDLLTDRLHRARTIADRNITTEAAYRANAAQAYKDYLSLFQKLKADPNIEVPDELVAGGLEAARRIMAEVPVSEQANALATLGGSINIEPNVWWGWKNRLPGADNKVTQVSSWSK